MRPPPPTNPAAEDLFRHQLSNLLDARHELVRLAGLINWPRFDLAYGALYAERGRPGLPTRLMVGLHLLKHVKGLSDEQVCAQWLENPYFQAFCGETYFQHSLPLDRSSMTRWRGRIGPDRLEAVLAETIATAMKGGAMQARHTERITIDTTVQTKAVAHPTDSHLLYRGIEWLNRLAKQNAIALRQSFLRLGKHAQREVGRLIHTGARKQAMRHLRKLRTYLGRLHRDVGRKLEDHPLLREMCREMMARIARLLAQKKDDKRKLYALHAPEVECIGKGKARIRWEFGVKVSLAVTNARAPGGAFVLGARACPGNPYDGHTLRAQLDQVERLTGQPVARAYVDLGYRGHDAADGHTEVYISRQRNLPSPTIKRELRRRSAIEPVIGHLKSDGLLERNHLAGEQGDAINAILAAAGHNLRLVLAWLRCFVTWWVLGLRDSDTYADTGQPAQAA
jgi:transposase, IS5 family